ncbi:MAG TPA: YihY/virulence factor BrkB family protein [Terriglobales bacterium]|nr:YihY/virulence factor BrkB family protein [Terriglobales bacterium]
MPTPMGKSDLSTSEQVSTIWSLGGLTIGQLVRKVIAGVNQDNLTGRAAELAFNFVLALFPLFIFLLSVLGLFAARAIALREDLFVYVSQVLPPDAAQVVGKTLNEVMRNASNGKLTFGIVLTVWFASGGMTSLMSALNGVYRVNERRSWVKVRAISFVLTIAISLLIILALVIVLSGGYLANRVGVYFGLHDVAVLTSRVVQWPVAIAFVTFSFSLIYYFAPDLEEQHWYWITPGSILGVLLWIGASFAFRAYLHFFNTYSRTYGSLGAVMILMMWLYVTGFAFLLGGDINAQIEHAAARRGHPEAKAPGEKKAA